MTVTPGASFTIRCCLNCSMRQLLQTARQAASLGADIIKKWLGRNVGYSLKAPADQVTQVDLEVEAALVDFISQRHGSHLILAEEGHGSYAMLGRPEAMVWVLDPLDGTTNFIHGWPMSAVSVGLLQNGSPLVGVVRHVYNDEEFYAIKGQGAWLNGQPIKVGNNQVLARALGAFAFPFRRRELQPAFLQLFSNIFDAVEDVRRSGSAALDLAYLAAGRTDFYFETNLKPWDMAAGILLVQEAGGRVTDFAGQADYLLEGHILASNLSLHPALLEFTLPWSEAYLK